MRTNSADEPRPEAGDEPGSTGPAPESSSSSRPALVFGDPLDQRSEDELNRGWGERPAANSGTQADLARFLDEKPPHHI